jgi:hypothetical protein
LSHTGVAGHVEIIVESALEAVCRVHSAKQTFRIARDTYIGNHYTNELAVGASGVASSRVKVLVVDLRAAHCLIGANRALRIRRASADGTV